MFITNPTLEQQVQDFVGRCFYVISGELFGTQRCPFKLLGPWMVTDEKSIQLAYQAAVSPNGVYGMTELVPLVFLFEESGNELVLCSCQATWNNTKFHFLISREADPNKSKYNWACAKRFEEAVTPALSFD